MPGARAEPRGERRAADDRGGRGRRRRTRAGACDSPRSRTATAADRLRGRVPRGGRRARAGAPPGRVLLARGHGRDGAWGRRHGPRHRARHLPGRRERGLRRGRRAVRSVRPAGGPRVHPGLRATARRDRRRRRVARSPPAARARPRSGPAEGAAPTDAAPPGPLPARDPTAAARIRRNPTNPLRPRESDESASSPRTDDPRDRRPDALPGDARRPAERQHPGTDPGAGPRHDPGPATCGPGAWAATGRVDDAPYGGGAGMVLRPEPVAAALDELRRPTRPRSSSTPPARSSARRARPTSPLDRISSSSAPATRASTNGSVRWSTSSSRSATTC